LLNALDNSLINFTQTNGCWLLAGRREQDPAASNQIEQP